MRKGEYTLVGLYLLTALGPQSLVALGRMNLVKLVPNKAASVALPVLLRTLRWCLWRWSCRMQTPGARRLGPLHQ